MLTFFDENERRAHFIINFINHMMQFAGNEIIVKINEHASAADSHTHSTTHALFLSLVSNKLSISDDKLVLRDTRFVVGAIQL